MSNDVETTSGDWESFGDLQRARDSILRLLRATEVTRADVRALQKDVTSEISLSRDEIEALFELDGKLGDVGSAWTEFLVHAATDHVVWAARPTGIVSDEQATWLLARVDETGSATRSAVLDAVLQEAVRVPDWFGSALAQRRSGAIIGEEHGTKARVAA